MRLLSLFLAAAAAAALLLFGAGHYMGRQDCQTDSWVPVRVKVPISRGGRSSAFTTSREEVLGVSLPIQLPARVVSYIDAFQFPASCDQDTPVTLFDNEGCGGFGALLVHMSWTMGVSMSQRRTYVVRDPDPTFWYTRVSTCQHSLMCGLHPLCACLEAEVDGTSEAAELARKTGSAAGFYGKTRPFVDTGVGEVRPDPDRVRHHREYWHAARGGNPTKSCKHMLWVPPQFRTVGTRREWDRMRVNCSFDAFDHIENGRERMSKDVLWWRSMIIGYIFQPLPHVMRIIEKKEARLKLPADGNCVAVHIRRGDKAAEGGEAKGAHPLPAYIELVEQLIAVHPSLSKKLFLNSDDLQGVTAEWKSQNWEAKGWSLLVDPLEVADSQGFDLSTGSLRDGEYETVLSSVWAMSSCRYMVGSLESNFLKLAIHVGIARDVYVDGRFLWNLTYSPGVYGTPKRKWYNFQP